ncbi:MAG: hypothetical protein FIB04_09385 [Gammaproteobacteria bacterium]|nr:hypothetical protein [Gammaproteobacteria bacterium]
MVERRRDRLRLALPWIAEVLGSQAPTEGEAGHAPAAEWLVARGRQQASSDSDWRAWLLDSVAGGVGLLARYPAGPCARASATGEVPQGTWACARPVHLLTAIDHLQLAPGRITLDAEETAILVRDCNQHFAGQGLRFHARGAAADWHVECASPIACSSVEPAVAAGRNLRDLMPAGRDGSRVRALTNEIQMLLHEHPVNVARAARGLPAVNSLWLWGFGSVEDVAPVSLPTLFTDDAWLAGLWRLHGAGARALETFESEAARLQGVALVGWSQPPEGGAAAALERADESCFHPLRELLRCNQVEQVDMLLGDRVVSADRGARLRFWRRVRPLQEALG